MQVRKLLERSGAPEENLEQFEKQYGRSLPEVYGPVITQNIADGLLREYTEESGERFLALTEKGLDVSNYVMAQFLF